MFFLTQAILGVSLAGFLAYLVYGREGKSGFRVRESDRAKPQGARMPSVVSLDGPTRNRRAPGSSGPRKAAPQILLTGISIDGTPSEILGVANDATRAQIQKAYRDLMKRFHPDLVGRPGSREWQDAQRIAEALNRSKDSLLSRKRA